MVFSHLMGVNFSYMLLQDWIDPEEERDRPELSGLLPHQKLLLLSDGSLTLDLELLYGSMVEVEVRLHGVTPLSKEAASYIEEGEGELAMEREVWLTIDGKRLVYAHSLIPIACVDKGLLHDLEEFSGEPLGRVLTTRKVFFTKERLGVGFVVCARASADLGISVNTPLAARRYILVNKEASGKYIIKASVTEIFSPEVVSSAFIKKLNRDAMGGGPLS